MSQSPFSLSSYARTSFFRALLCMALFTQSGPTVQGSMCKWLLGVAYGLALHTQAQNASFPSCPLDTCCSSEITMEPLASTFLSDTQFCQEAGGQALFHDKEESVIPFEEEVRMTKQKNQLVNQTLVNQTLLIKKLRHKNEVQKTRIEQQKVSIKTLEDLQKQACPNDDKVILLKHQLELTQQAHQVINQTLAYQNLFIETLQQESLQKQEIIEEQKTRIRTLEETHTKEGQKSNTNSYINNRLAKLEDRLDTQSKVSQKLEKTIKKKEKEIQKLQNTIQQHEKKNMAQQKEIFVFTTGKDYLEQELSTCRYYKRNLYWAFPTWVVLVVGTAASYIYREKKSLEVQKKQLEMKYNLELAKKRKKEEEKRRKEEEIKKLKREHPEYFQPVFVID